MVTLLAARSWSLTVTEDLPSIHRFADVDTTVVHKIHLHHIVTANLKKLSNRPSEKIVADVTEVKRFIGIW